jgi:hypothetical protein
MSNKVRDGQKAMQAVRDKIQGKFFNKSKIQISMFETDRSKDDKAKSSLQPGDEYTDREGKVWYKDENKVLKNKSTFLGKHTMPFFCPDCSKIMKGKADNKMWTFHQKCMNCVAEIETKMRIDGTYDAYVNDKVQANVKSWIADMENLLEDWNKDQAQEKLQFLMNSSGDLETWDTSKSENKDKTRLEEVLQEVKTKLEENSNEV